MTNCLMQGMDVVRLFRCYFRVNMRDYPLNYLYTFVLWISSFVVFFIKDKLTIRYLYLMVLLFITTIVESIGLYCLVNKISTRVVYHIFLPIEYLLFSLYFHKTICLINIKKVILVSIPIMLIWSVINSWYFQSFKELNTYFYLIVALMITFWCICYFFELLNKDDYSGDIYIKPDFWISTGALFFYAGSFFIISFNNFFLKNDRDVAKAFWNVLLLLNILMYGLITYGFICQAKYQEK